MTRLSALLQDRLDDEQRAVLEAIVGGKRGSGASLGGYLDARGALRGPFNAMVHRPDLGMVVQRLGEMLRFEGRLTGAQREIGILVVAVVTLVTGVTGVGRLVGLLLESGVVPLRGLAHRQTEIRRVQAAVRKLQAGRGDDTRVDGNVACHVPQPGLSVTPPHRMLAGDVLVLMNGHAHPLGHGEAFHEGRVETNVLAVGAGCRDASIRDQFALHQQGGIEDEVRMHDQPQSRHLHYVTVL